MIKADPCFCSASSVVVDVVCFGIPEKLEQNRSAFPVFPSRALSKAKSHSEDWSLKTPGKKVEVGLLGADEEIACVIQRGEVEPPQKNNSFYIVSFLFGSDGKMKQSQSGSMSRTMESWKLNLRNTTGLFNGVNTYRYNIRLSETCLETLKPFHT